MYRSMSAAAAVTTAVVFLASLRVHAAAVPVGHPSLWPVPIDSVQGFDRASRADLLVYAAALEEAAGMNSAELARALDLATIDAASVSRWLDSERNRVVVNFRRASERCGHEDWTCAVKPTSFAALAAAGRSLPRVIPVTFAAWHRDLAAFSQGFALEQLRLAALFPAGGNETQLFSNLEWTGDTLPDRTFALTFDDGPTAAGGTTDQTLALLRTLNKSAAF